MFIRDFEFQSTLPRGERRGTTSTPTGSTTFQSTLPRGERLMLTRLIHPTYDFNPRSREGSDSLDDSEQKGDGISIHAPARGATE